MRRLNSVLANLAISYVTIVVVIVLLLCSIFYLYVPRNYNEEIKAKNEMLLENAANTLEASVIERINTIYLDITLANKTDFDGYTRDSFKGKSSNIMDLQMLMKQEVINNADLVHAIHLYDPKSKAMISSLYGLKYEVDLHNEAFRTMDWIDAMRQHDASYLWTKPRLVPKDIYSSVSDNNTEQPLLTYVHSYPFNSTGKTGGLLIGIDIKESAINAIIGQLMPADLPNTYLMDQQGIVISAADKTVLGKPAEQPASIRDQFASGSPVHSYVEKIDRTDYVISGHKLPSNGWTIYNIIQENNFYKKSIVLQKVIVAICLAAILIGLVLSGIFTVVSYQPVKRLVNKIKGLFDAPAEARHNEFKLIDTAFHQLTSKVSTLEETLHANKPVIKHNVVMNMLRGSYADGELEEQLQSLDLALHYNSYCCLVIDPVSQGFTELDSKTNQFVIYSLINQLEAAVLEGTRLIAEQLPDRKIAVIVGTQHPDDHLLERIACQIVSDVKDSFGLDFKIALGVWVHDCALVHRSFEAAEVLIKYGFFFSEDSIIQAYNLLSREQSHLELPPSAMTKFKEKLQARNHAGVAAALDQVLRELRDGQYSADYGRFVLMNMISMYSDFLKNVRFKQSGQFKIDLYKQYRSIYSLDSFREWFIASITDCYGQMDKRSDDRAFESIEAVKQYIGDHLADDLSLEAVAAQVFLSPKYLSKIFKEETGIGYTEFVTKKRMEQAVELMKGSSFTVEQVAAAVGYGTTAYFIKKFKEMNGCTPKTYVRDVLKQG
ncbi:AraC-like DNA-binding protein [Paenibacillus phyllosphaerae]|uniref:AraC-like DNA-binding protein n=1 Tax=Paenibacillus phyllosphaerae TaxID=274593 RepID=A0A7W5FNM7_9BACL|nr:AraC family transcriptional regulator [Paenibacillus phyllosphaerae]MBB3111506.1 AraC-like DNA-binding protein [Paenibacillus phyllosphaerae]